MKLSKSKLALAKVINENGGWVGVADCATQDKDVRVCFYEGKPTRCGDSWKDNGDCLYKYGFDSGEKIPNWHQCVLKREEYYQAYPKADADGWIEWDGLNIAPVKNGVEVDIKFRDGDVVTMFNSTFMRWSHRESPSDIIAYRLHKQDVNHEFCESVMRSIPEPELKPTIEQLAQEYRNAKDHADRLQKEAGEAAVKAESFAVEIRKKILELQELIG